MITRQEIEGKWNQVKGSILERWGELTDDDIQVAQGNADQLVGVIQEKTGAGRREIEDFIHDTLSGGASAVNEFAQSAKNYAADAARAARDGYDHAADRVKSGYKQAEGLVRERPAESVAVAFGSGIIAGVILGLVLKR